MTTALDTVLSVYLGFVVILILAGNTLVISAFALGSRRMKTYTNYFIVNLAISDMLVGMLSVPYWIYISTLPIEQRTREKAEYQAFQSMDILFGTISILNLVSLTFERLIAVKYPAYHFNLTWKPVALVLSLTWILGLIFAGFGFLVPRYMKNAEYLYLLFTLDFALPTLLIIGCYIIIFKIARDSSSMSNKRVKKDMKIARMILIIIGLFLICWLPFFALSITYYNCYDWCAKIPESLTRLFKAMHYTNSMMNFWVYAVRSPDFRRSFNALIRWKLPRLRSETVTSFHMRHRTTSNNQSQSNQSNDGDMCNGNMANNDTLSTPLPIRAARGDTQLTSI
ncbi:probable G-protein coupled receptor No9 [Rhopilema esculentum]|uniref:probable G-protein coupled receptor No9 n=1 Tax=Rhopilema esculentum TaxID=499914 RepID=UPI0031E1142B